MRIDVQQSSQIDFRLLSAHASRISLLRTPVSRTIVLRFWVVQIRAVHIIGVQAYTTVKSYLGGEDKDLIHK